MGWRLRRGKSEERSGEASASIEQLTEGNEGKKGRKGPEADEINPKAELMLGFRLGLRPLS